MSAARPSKLVGDLHDHVPSLRRPDEKNSAFNSEVDNSRQLVRLGRFTSRRHEDTTEDLDQAELIGDQLVSAVGSREEAPASLADVSTQRQRNFTLFLNAYDQVRRAVTFLRWNEGDLDRIAPSLYSGRGNSNARTKPAPQPAPPSVAPGTAVPVTAPVPAPVDPSASPRAAAIPVGFPGASPFASIT